MERRRGTFTGDPSPRGKSGNSGVCVAPRTWVPDQVRNNEEWVVRLTGLFSYQAAGPAGVVARRA